MLSFFIYISQCEQKYLDKENVYEEIINSFLENPFILNTAPIDFISKPSRVCYFQLKEHKDW